jgi:LacI family gluconate utilization system Gnt-I transcriptional repressor
VSRALSTPDLVKPETRQRVMQAVERLGYVVNNYASSLRSGRSTIISMFVAGLANPHIAGIVRGCAEALEGSGFHLMMTQVPSLDTIDADRISSVLPLRPAALVFAGVVGSPSLRQFISGRGIPVMEMWDLVDDPIDMLVGFSHYEGGWLMGEHFAERGFTRPAYAGRTGGRGAERLRGFSAGFGAAPDLVVPITGPVSFAAGGRALQAVLAGLPDCDAVFFSNDIQAMGAAMHAAGDPALRRIAIAGFGDILFSGELPVPITTVRTSGYDVGRQAGNMLLRRLGDHDVPQRTVICDSMLQVRASTMGAGAG